MSDEMDFLIDEEVLEVSEPRNYWNVLIVDDDISIHDATKYALSNFSFLDKKIKWFDAFSAEEAKELFQTEKDIALLFLDVVMESDDAGLKFVQWFRENRINPSTRIILRTGQPGQAPERQIIVNYDLHDYKTKTELSSDKLFTTTVAALRSYYDMYRLEITKLGLEGIIRSSGSLFKIQSMYEYARSVLCQIGSILDIRSSGIICAQSKKDNHWEILAETGRFNKPFTTIMKIISECDNEESKYIFNEYLVRILTESGSLKYAIYIEPTETLNDIQINMLLMFCNNISIGLSNIKLYNSLLHSHKAIVMSLARITEFRDHDTGEHVFRIAKGTEKLTRELFNRNIYPDEINENLIEVIGLASTLHDIGKVATPDNILLKPGKLTSEEFEIIKQHSSAGASILQSAIDFAGGDKVEYLEVGKNIAFSHHERWDGTGYPRGISKTDIPIEARITTIVDVFDALITKRCYKKGFPVEEAVDIIIKGKEIFFDPLIVEVFLEVYNTIFE